MRTLLSILTLATLCGLSYAMGRTSHQNVNDLIRVGFTVIDPEGFPVSHFDER